MAEPKHILNANVMYTAAWNEISQRLTIRGQINIYHIYVIVTLAAIFVAAAGVESPSPYLIAIPSVLMPFVSGVFVLWYQHNDKIIGLLSSYCQEFERMDFKMSDSHEYPKWFFKTDNTPAGEGLFDIALGARKLSDAATALICLVSPVLGLSAAYIQFTKLATDTTFIVLSFGFASLGTLFCVYLAVLTYSTARMRNSLMKREYDAPTGFWKDSRD